jgi:hypothetical protein
MDSAEVLVDVKRRNREIIAAETIELQRTEFMKILQAYDAGEINGDHIWAFYHTRGTISFALGCCHKKKKGQPFFG